MHPSTTEEAPRRRRANVQKRSDKENNADSSVDSSHTSKRDSRKISQRNSKKGSKSGSVSSKDAAMTKFQDAAAVTSLHSFWKPSLVEHVVRASQALCHEKTTSFLLEEYASQVQSTCRTLVKEATESKRSDETLKLLYVAINGLRAICPLLEEEKKKEAIIKILYHAVTTASDVCVKSNSDSMSKDALSQCLAAYQALGFLLNGYQVQTDEKENLVILKWKPSHLFPLPRLSLNSGAGAGTMTMKQVFKIAMQATYSTTTAVSHAYTSQLCQNVSDSLITNDFGSYTNEIMQQLSSYDTMICLAQNVTIPWTCVLSCNELVTRETIQESLTFAKRMFRLLFEVASQMDKSSKMNTAADSLLLRQHAILTFLFSSKDMVVSRSMQSAIRKHHWESACSYACKASIAYRQQMAKGNRRESDDESFDRFHEDVGAVLDSFATDYSLAYVEYCAHRAIYSSRKVSQHGDCESQKCMVGQLGFRYRHGDCDPESDSSAAAGHAMLAVVFMILSVQRDFEVLISGKKWKSHPDGKLANDFLRTREVIIANFRSIFVNATITPPHEVMTRCYKILELVGVNRKVYQILSKDSPGGTSRASLIALETFGLVLTECIGPLAVSLIQSEEDKDKLQQMWELSADSYNRGLSVFERLREDQLRMDSVVSDDIPRNISNALSGLFTLCRGSKFVKHRSEETLEKAAKTIFSIGRARRDRKEYDQALLPLCLGNDLFAELTWSRGCETAKESQLSMRYSHLAFTFSSLDMSEEACLALVLAIVYDIVASLATEKAEPDESDYLIKELSALTNGTVYMEPAYEAPNGRRSLINRLVCLSETLVQKEWSLPTCSKGEDFTVLTRRLLRDAAGLGSDSNGKEIAGSDKLVRFSIATLLSAAFKNSKLFGEFKETRPTAVRREQLLTMANVVAEQGFMLQESAMANPCESSFLRVQMKEFYKSFQYLEWLSKNTCQDDENANDGLVALVHIVSTVSLAPSPPPSLLEVFRKSTDSLPSKQDKTSALLSQAQTLLSKATEILNKATDHVRDDEQRLLLCVLKVCASMYSFDIRSDGHFTVSAATKNEVLLHGRDSVELLMGRNVMGDRTRESLGRCLTRTLTRFQDTVNLEGDKVAAVQAAILIARIYDGTGDKDENWYRASASTLLSEVGLNAIASDWVHRDYVLNEQLVIDNDFKVNDVIQLELLAAQLRIKVHSLDEAAFKAAASETLDLFDKCNEIIGQPEIEPFIRIVLRWICSSCVIALAEGYASWGSPYRALQYQRLGVNICRESISSLRKLRNYSNLVNAGGCSAAWIDIALSTLILRVAERRVFGQQRMSCLYARLGDHRRSEAYAFGAAKECLPSSQAVSKQRLKVNELASIDMGELHAICQSASYRLLLEMKAKASPSDRVLESLEKSAAFDVVLSSTKVSHAADRVAWQMENIRNLIHAGDLHYQSANDPDKRFKEFYQAADCEMNALIKSPATTRLLSSLSCQHRRPKKHSQIFEPLCAEVKLRRVRVLLSDSSQESESLVSDILGEITETLAATARCRAWAHYYLGLIDVHIARQAGALQDLWAKYTGGECNATVSHRFGSRREGQHAMESARSHLRSTLLLVGPASDALVRDAMRTLALLAGPLRGQQSVTMSAAGLIHSSIGATTRQVVTNALTTDETINGSFESTHDTCDEDLACLFGSLDTPWSELTERNERMNRLLDETSKALPATCRVIAVVLCPTGEILVTSLSKSTDEALNLEIETACIFPDAAAEESILDSTVYSEVMKPLDELIRLNEDQIRGLDTTTVADNFKEESSKRDWWDERQHADDQLRSHIEEVESKYFSSQKVRRVFLGDDDDDMHISCGNLASKFEQAYAADDKSDENVASKEDMYSMTVNQLREELEKLQVHVTTRKRPSKKQLVDMVVEARAASATRPEKSGGTSDSDEKCMLLILDENLHRFPFEGMEICSKWAVSRVPSLPFAVAPLIKSQSNGDSSPRYPEVDPAGASYIVDPEGNLPQTKNRLVPAITDICSSNKWKWNSVIGSLPSKDFVQDALTQHNSLLLYCGHGGSTCCFSRSQVESLTKNQGNQGSRRCKSAIILMGCSSGKLISVNRKDSMITDKVTMFYEPEGIALSYLCAAAPCVVGNLWDVTDRDIDRYCITLLEKFLVSNDGQSLAKCVAEARGSCKMRHIVGLAPVCYGVPVHLAKQ